MILPGTKWTLTVSFSAFGAIKSIKSPPDVLLTFKTSLKLLKFTHSPFGKYYFNAVTFGWSTGVTLNTFAAIKEFSGS